MKIAADRLVDYVNNVLTAVQVRDDDARIVAENLVAAELTGHGTHGVVRLPRYVEEIQAGEINLSAEIKITEQRSASLLIDGDWGFGQVIANQTVDLLIPKARQHGVASAGVFHSNDVGRLGAYTMRIAAQGLLGLMTINDGGGSPHIAPWGGIAPLFSTNPLSFAAPLNSESPVCIDMSTSVCAGSRVLLAQKRGDVLPPGLIMDSQGKPSTDPNDLFASPPGSLLPLGAPVAGHKGTALNLIVDVLSGALTGAGCSGRGTRETQGIFFLVIDVEAFAAMEDFQERVVQLLKRMKNNPTAEGVDEIRIPGEHGERMRQQQMKDGIVIEPAIWREISQIADKLGVSPPLADAG